MPLAMFLNDLSGTPLPDTLTGGNGPDTLEGLGGDDTLSGLGGADSLDGGDGNDSLLGGAGADTLLGGAGADVLDGGTGIDSMDGGEGGDTYIVDSSSDVVSDSGTSGVDVVLSSRNYSLGAGIETLILTGTADLNGTGNALGNIIGGNSGANRLNGAGGNDDLIGEAGNDTLLGGGGHDNLAGGEGADSLQGDTGNDRLEGGAGADTMDGGEGSDTYVVDDLGDVVSDTGTLAGANDTVRTVLAALTLGANLESLIFDGAGSFKGTGNGLDNFINGGADDDSLLGQGGDDTLVGGSGADALMGDSGADSMVGGAGSDFYAVDNVGDLVVETDTLAGDIDVVRCLINAYTLGANVETLVFTGSGGFQGTGNALANSIIGASGNDSLAGGDGADGLDGGLGADLLDGGTGADTMVGGTGNDTFVVDDAGDVVVEADTLSAFRDTVLTSLSSLTLAVNVENLTFTGTGDFTGTGNGLNNAMVGGLGDDVLAGGNGQDTLTGGEGADTLNGEAGNDRLDGGLGADSMVGGTGSDTYIVDNSGDVVLETETLAGVIDTVQTSLSTYTLGANVENLVATRFVGISGFGNALANTMTGGKGPDSLAGLGGNDTILGGFGDDRLNGGTGEDRLTGSFGADRFVVGVAGSSADKDTVTDFVSGTDAIIFDQAPPSMIGDGDATLENLITRAGPGGWGAANELVIFTANLAALSNANAAAAAGAATAAVATTKDLIFVFDDGVSSGIYRFTSLDGNAVVSAGELTLLMTLQNTASTVVADYLTGLV